uniref:Uncharacterized protein n=1 Tax=Oryza barthii TaxID=65489 RepID=A0A0D3G906_9ORYZ
MGPTHYDGHDGHDDGCRRAPRGCVVVVVGGGGGGSFFIFSGVKAELGQARGVPGGAGPCIIDGRTQMNRTVSCTDGAMESTASGSINNYERFSLPFALPSSEEDHST